MGASRPGEDLPRTPFEWIVETLAALGVAGALLLVALSWGELPDRMPAHFDALGRPDRWGEKGTVLLLPVVMLVLWVSLSALSFVPHLYNYPWKVPEGRVREQRRLGREMVGVTKAVLVWTLFWIVRGTIRVGTGQGGGLGAALLPVLLGGLAAVLALYMVRFHRLRRP